MNHDGGETERDPQAASQHLSGLVFDEGVEFFLGQRAPDRHAAQVGYVVDSGVGSLLPAIVGPEAEAACEGVGLCEELLVYDARDRLAIFRGPGYI